jgi:transposase
MNLASSTATESHDINALWEQNRALSDQVSFLKNELDWFRRQLFGSKSEKRLIDAPGAQLDWLAALQAPATDAGPAADIETVTYQRKKSRRDNTVSDSGLRFDDTVPMETIVLSAPGLEGIPESDQIVISEKISYRLAQRPGSYVVIKTIRPVIKLRSSQQLITAPMMDQVLERSIADVSFLAGLLVDKFVYHLPLHRQHQRITQCGIDLSRMTLTNLGNRAIALLEPIYDAQLTSILRSRVLAIDETPIKSGRQGASKGKMHKGYYWPVYGEQDEIAFCYRPTRKASHVNDILGDQFSGVLLSDGYEAYARYARAQSGMIHAQCWSHTRRYFEQAERMEPRASGEALAIIGELYGYEQHIRDHKMTGTEKAAYRENVSRPVVEEFWCWCEEQCQRGDLLPSNPLTKALKYAMARKDSLMVYLSDPEVPIDTNHLERALRPIPMGRRSWLFCWTELGAKQVGIIQSLLVTCKLHQINPTTYLVDVLQRISDHPSSRVSELTPREWKERFAEDPMKSVLER